ncbi:retrotransposon protein, putative, ty3-gypsy subclass [Tanacetum coccineum]
MNRVFHEYLDKFFIVFIDVIFLYSKTREEHEDHLRILLERLRQKKLYAKLFKCDFWLGQVAFFGHILSADGITIDHAKVKVITKWPRPTIVTEVRSFLGLAGYYRRFMEEFSLLDLFLMKLMRKGEKFVWNEDREKSFEELKKRLVSSPVLTLPSWTGGYQIYSDASKKGLGCILMQHGKVIAYESRQLKPYEANVVADALSRKNSRIMVYLKIQHEIIRDLELMEVELVVRGSEGDIASLNIEPKLISWIKEAQNEDEVVLTKALRSPFSIHLDSTYMYKDLKQNFWWNASRNSDLEVGKIFQQEIIRLHGTPASIVSHRICVLVHNFGKYSDSEDMLKSCALEWMENLERVFVSG